MRLWPWKRRPPTLDPERARQVDRAAAYTLRAARLAEEIEQHVRRLEELREGGRDGRAQA
jgi:hypothetical protein